MDAFSFLSVFAIIIFAASSTASTNLDGFYANNVNLTASRYKRQCPSLVGCAPSTQLPLIPGRTNCVLPELPDNGKWTVFDAPTKYPGEIVPSKTVLQFQCDSNFKLLPEIEFSVCYKFWSVVPVCLKTCHSLHSTQLMHISCEIDNQETSCNDPYNGSVARVTCASSRLNKYLKCIDGKWDASLPTCKPESLGLDGSNSSKCSGFLDLNDESITDAYLGQFPFMAAIGYMRESELSFRCTGALIDEKYVIIPAYCAFVGDFDGPKLVRLGTLNPNKNTSETQDAKVREVRVHPDYIIQSTYNNIALIRLEKPVTLNANVQTIPLIASDTVESRGILVGWIHPDVNDDLHKGSLIRTTMATVNVHECSKSYPATKKLNRSIDDKTQLCKKWTHEDCKEKSLAPAGVSITENQDVPCTFSLVSIASFGKASLPYGPDVNQKVFPYTAWIDAIVRSPVF